MHKRERDRKKSPFFSEERLFKISYSGTLGLRHENAKKTIEIFIDPDCNHFFTYTRLNEKLESVTTEEKIDDATIHEFKSLLSKVNISAFPTKDISGCCDGGLTEIEMARNGVNTHLSWWYAPTEWEKLDRTTQYIIYVIENKFIKKKDIDKSLEVIKSRI